MEGLSTALAPEASDKAVPVSGTVEGMGSQPSTQPATTPSPQKEPPATGGALNEDNSAWLANKGFKSNDDIVNSYRNLERQLGNSVTLPGDDAKPEDLAKFRSRLGVPDKPDGYELKLPDGLPEQMPYPDEDVAAFKGWAHEAGLTPKQAQAIHDKFVAKQAEALQGWEQTVNARLAETQAELIKENGPTDSQKFQQFVADAARGLKAVDVIAPGMRQELAELGALIVRDGKPYPASARVMKVLATLGTLYGEDGGLIGSGNTAGGDNPFVPGHSYNVTQQALLRRTDPERAKALYLQAGGDPRRWR